MLFGCRVRVHVTREIDLSQSIDGGLHGVVPAGGSGQRRFRRSGPHGAVRDAENAILTEADRRSPQWHSLPWRNPRGDG